MSSKTSPAIEVVAVERGPEGTKILALVSVRVGGVTFHGWKVLKGRDGHWAAPPGRKLPSGQWGDAIEFENEGLKKRIVDVVLAGYEAHQQKGPSGGPYDPDNPFSDDPL